MQSSHRSKKATPGFGKIILEFLIRINKYGVLTTSVLCSHRCFLSAVALATNRNTFDFGAQVIVPDCCTASLYIFSELCFSGSFLQHKNLTAKPRDSIHLLHPSSSSTKQVLCFPDVLVTHEGFAETVHSSVGCFAHSSNCNLSCVENADPSACLRSSYRPPRFFLSHFFEVWQRRQQ